MVHSGTGSRLAASVAYERIRSSLISGELPPGAPLREEELAEELGVSRTPIREALRRLDAEGLVDVLPNRGARVATWSSKELDDIFSVRLRLEPYGARLAAHTIGADGIQRLRELADRMALASRGSRTDRLDRISEANNAFHSEIVAATGNLVLERTLAIVIQQALVNHTFRRYHPGDLDRSIHHHFELIDALEAGDGDWAEAVMRVHILAARNVLGQTPSEPVPSA